MHEAHRSGMQSDEVIVPIDMLRIEYDRQTDAWLSAR